MAGFGRKLMEGAARSDAGDVDTAAPPPLAPALEPDTPTTAHASTTDIIRDQLLSRVEPAVAVRMTRAQLMTRVFELVAQIASEQRLLLNEAEQQALAANVVDEMIGLGALENLLRDTTVSDILVNGPRMTYVERRGKLELTSVKFRNDAHVMHVAQRIASSIGRRVDESSPMLDARLADGSRVNVIIPPLSLRGPCVSIRKFSRSMMSMPKFVEVGTVSPALARMLEIAARCRLNIIVSGGTGSGKTTLLNALSSMIDKGERIITIEDAAELQLQQPHVIQLETRPANIEGKGQIAQRDLVRNALRMRPDRIIIGEVRGSEAFDMMQAMNTGHKHRRRSCATSRPAHAPAAPRPVTSPQCPSRAPCRRRRCRESQSVGTAAVRCGACQNFYAEMLD